MKFFPPLSFKVLLLAALLFIGFVATPVRANYLTLPVDGAVITSWFDHDGDEDGSMTAYVGTEYEGVDIDLDTCSFHNGGVGCYDGHNGIDFAKASGTEILAVADGEVTDVWFNTCNGWAVHVWHEDLNLSTIYAHVATVTVATTSDTVSRGDVLAFENSTGICARGTHLHFGVLDGQATATSNRIDPFGWWATTTDPWAYNQGYLWTTYPPSFALASTVNNVTVSADTFWPGGNYVIDGSLTIASSATLTLAPGTVVKFKTTTSSLTVNGTLLALGTAARPIHFTSYKDDSVGGDTNGDGAATTPAAGNWYEIAVNAGGVATFAHARVAYGGNSYGNDANIFVNGGELSVTSSLIATGTTFTVCQWDGTTTIADSELTGSSYGLYVYGGNASLATSSVHHHTSVGVVSESPGTLTVTGSDLSYNGWALWLNLNTGTSLVHSGNTGGHNTYNALGFGGTFDTDWTFRSDGLPYLIDGLITVASGTTATIEPGVVLKFPSAGAGFLVQGTLNVSGTAASTTYFTSLKDDTVGGDTNGDGTATTPAPGNWRGISVPAGGQASLAYTSLRYGGNAVGDDANLSVTGGSVSIASSTVVGSAAAGIRHESGTLSLSDTEVKTNANGLDAVSGGTGITLYRNSFTGNTSYALYGATLPTTTAEYQYWGSASGPATGGGRTPPPNRVTPLTVDYTPWLTSWP